MPATVVQAHPIPIISMSGTEVVTAPAPKWHRIKLLAAAAVAGLSIMISIISLFSELNAPVVVYPVKKSVITGQQDWS
jgi:hypothetical protein